jgi:hypothetical protein
MNANFVPTGIVWIGTLGRPSDLPSDQIVPVSKGSKRGRIVFPSTLKGRLSTQEWRPLIASSLAFFFLQETRRIWKYSRILRVMFFTAIAWTIVVLLTISTLLKSGDLLPYFIPSGIFFQAVLFLVLRYWDLNVIRNVRLEADRIAAGIVGAEQFIHILEKIDSMRIEDLEENKARKKTIWTRKGVYSWPNINERLNNLTVLRSSMKTQA